MKNTFKSALNNTALAAFASVTLLGSTPVSTAGVFAKFDGVEGESTDADHDKWIDVLSVQWGMRRAGEGATGATRSRGAVVTEDMVLTKLIDKVSPKMMASCVRGEVIPKLEIESSATYTDGARATYLKYELTNVMVTSYKVGPSAGENRPTVEVGLNFEEIKVTYTENDAAGKKKGNVEYSWKVEEGEG